MNFAFTEEQDELRKSVRKFLDDKSPMASVRRLMEGEVGFDEDVWKQATEQLGLAGLAIPENYGGLGYGAVELGIVLEEMGRSLFCGPYFSSVVMAANAIIASGDQESMSQHLPSIATGEARYTICGYEEAHGFDLTPTSGEAVADGDHYLLSASKVYVIDGASATDFLVFAKVDGELSLFYVSGSADAVTRTPMETLDQTRKLAKVEFVSAPAHLIGAVGDGSEIYAKMLNVAAAALSVEMVGGAQACLDMAVEYSKSRIQFGRPIGSFQAIKHKCADILVEVESAKSAAYYAMWAVANDPNEAMISAPLAKAFCGDAYFFAAAENIQIHGGIGFTWEHDAHLYFKRAKSSQLLFGSSSDFRSILAERIGL